LERFRINTTDLSQEITFVDRHLTSGDLQNMMQEHAGRCQVIRNMKLLAMIQINHQPDATIFQFIILTFIYNSTCFGRFPAHHQELIDCSGSLWFYLRIVVTVVSCSWSGRFITECHDDTKVKPEAATAVNELLIMGGKTHETCWVVNKRQDNKLETCCIWLVIYFNCTVMMHGLTNLKLLAMSDELWRFSGFLGYSSTWEKFNCICWFNLTKNSSFYFCPSTTVPYGPWPPVQSILASFTLAII
jgi:hypothetical protein